MIDQVIWFVAGCWAAGLVPSARSKSIIAAHSPADSAVPW
jgi:hypothetical protein